MPIWFTSRFPPRENAENVVCITGFRSSSLDSPSLIASAAGSLVKKDRAFLLRANARGFATGCSGTTLRSRGDVVRKSSGSGAAKMSKAERGAEIESSSSSTSYDSGTSSPTAACGERPCAASPAGLSSGYA